MIDEVEIQIGGQTIDKHYGEWLTIWNELTQTASKQAGYDTMIGQTSGLTTPAASVTGETLYVPLQFWFCKNPGLALPLIALQYHEVKFNVTFRSVADCYIQNGGITSGTPSLGNASLFIDYIYLDTDERRQFAQTRHEYLIEQLQFGGAESVSSSSYKSKLAFNHPCKEIIWVIQRDDAVDSGVNGWSNFANSGAHQLVDAKLQLNGQDRFATRKAVYFNAVQPYQHHTRVPDNIGVYCYSFGLHPEQFQPSGTVNMSRIDSAILQLSLANSDASKLRVYAVNVNVLKIMSGLGGLSYSN